MSNHARLYSAVLAHNGDPTLARGCARLRMAAFLFTHNGAIGIERPPETRDGLWLRTICLSCWGISPPSLIRSVTCSIGRPAKLLNITDAARRPPSGPGA